MAVMRQPPSTSTAASRPLALEGSDMKDVPLYQQIADHFRDRIISGDLAPGARLPTEHAVADQWSTTRSTAVRALRVLVQAGLADVRRPFGYTVREPQRRDTYRLDSFEPQIAGHTADVAIEVGVVQAPALADRLHVQRDASLVVRRRTELRDRRPWAARDTYAPQALVEGTAWMTPQRIDGGTGQLLARLGREPVRFTDEITVRMPLPDLADRFAIRPGTPVTEITTTAYTATGTPAQVTVATLPGDRYTLTAHTRQRP